MNSLQVQVEKLSPKDGDILICTGDVSIGMSEEILRFCEGLGLTKVAVIWLRDDESIRKIYPSELAHLKEILRD